MLSLWNKSEDGLFGGFRIGGAMCINLIFGVVLAGWLLLAGSLLLSRAVLVLSLLADALVLISLSEITALPRHT